MAAPTRWERIGEPGSAFHGLSRGRGSRGRGGHRGGRGSSRANPTTREQTAQDSTHASRDNPPQQAAQPTQVTQPSAAIPSTPRSFKPPRNPSRGDPPPLQAPGTQARSSNRRRRSQVSKSSAIDTKLSATALTDGLPASTLTKDPPPHLKRHVDARHDIDALVERVRAVAMDHRPITPGSHIDWAGDDDDTLPDLNDWGVNTAKFAPGEPETISPIILDGLKPLPVISAPTTPSPLRQAATLDNPATSDVKGNVIKNECEVSPTPSRSDEEQVTVSISPVASTNMDTVERPSPSKHVCAPYPSNQKPWHPSLPAKPPTGSLGPRVNLRPVATPMRNPVYPKFITSTHKESSIPKEVQCALEQVAAESTSATSPMSVEVVSAIIKLADEIVLETSNTEGRTNSRESDNRPDPDSSLQRDIFDDGKAEGLEASIHAPKTLAPIVTVIPHLTTTPRNKKEADNRCAPLPRNANGEPVNRLKSWGERSGLQSVLSPRQSSSKGAGAPSSHHRIHTSRPIITGDAMSRLARTIGQTNSAT